MRPTLLASLLALGACDASPEASWLASLQASLPQAFTLDVSPMFPGGTITVTVTGAPVGADLRLARTVNGAIAPGPCPAVLGGECLDIAGSVVVTNIQDADPSGTSTFTIQLPGTLQAGSTVQFQVVALLGGVATGSAPIERTVGDACTQWLPPELADLDGSGDAELVYRLPITFTNQSLDLTAPPLTATVNFRAALTALGDNANLDVNAVRVYKPACDGTFVEVRSQYIDALTALDQKADHDSPLGDSIGTLALLYELDGDLGTEEVFPGDAEQTYYVYFGSRGVTGGTAPATAYPTDLVTAQTLLQNDELQAYFDPARGGMLADLNVPGSPTLTSQSDSCCGNSMAFWQAPEGWVDPQDAASTRLRVLARGPILSAVKAEGTRVADDGTLLWGSYSYEATYWTFSRTPVVYYSMWQQATADSTNNHIEDAADGFRPWESYQLALFSQPFQFAAGTLDDPWIQMTTDDWGVWIGMVHPATYLTELGAPIISPTGAALNQYLAFYANDLVDYGGGTPQTFPSGSVWFDHIGFAIVPFADPTDAPDHPVRPALADALMVGIDAVVGAPELP
jgi:hypothetical protein